MAERPSPVGRAMRIVFVSDTHLRPMPSTFQSATFSCIKPKAHAFGHIHYSTGSGKMGVTLFVNACVCTERCEPWQKPVVVDPFQKGGVVVGDE